MNKRGVEELGPHISIETLLFAIISIAVLVMLIVIFAGLRGWT